MKAKATAGTLLAWLRTIGTVADECTLYTSELDVVSTCVVDPANAQMVSIRIPDHVWDHLELDGSRINVDLPSLIHKIEQFPPSDMITLSIEPYNETTGLKITNGYDMFKVQTLGLGQVRKTPTEPTIDSAAQFRISGDVLREMFAKAATVSDIIRIGMDPAGEDKFASIYVKAESDTAEYETHLRYHIGIHKAAEVSSLFSLDYLQDIAPHLNKTVTIGIGNDESIQICYPLYGASVRYIQAPRIEP